MGQQCVGCRSDSFLSYSKQLGWALAISMDVVITIPRILLSENPQNTCGLNEPCRGWNDTDGECVYFTKFEEDKLDKACKKHIQIICLCMKQVWFQQLEVHFGRAISFL